MCQTQRKKVAAVCLLLLCSACGSGQSEHVRIGAPEPINAPVGVTGTEKVDLSNLTFALFEGGTRSISYYRGQPLVINFFASWCPPCVREMPEFQSVSEDLRGKVTFLGLSQDRNNDDGLALVDLTGVTYDIGEDADLEVFKATSSVAMPTTAFVSPEGALLDVWAGALDREALLQHIERTLNVKTPN